MSWQFRRCRQAPAQPKLSALQLMYFGVDYYPEHWVYPYGGSAEAPESRWERGIELMLEAGVNVVRMGEVAWGLYEPEGGKFGFDLVGRAMELLGRAAIGRRGSRRSTARSSD